MTSIPESFASLDLGSNSFHMIVASYQDGRLQIIDRLRETVRLASGLDDKGKLSEESIMSALDCLERFGQRLREIPKINVRVVGTNTLRKAKNGAKFQKMAREALGHPIEIVSGVEEARLIFLGVSHAVYNDSETRLVMDIGGGSTEFIIGQGYQPMRAESLYMGCVGMTKKYFADGEITAKRMKKAILSAKQELESIEKQFRRKNWDRALGASGTILAIHDIVRQSGWSEKGITAASLDKLHDAVIASGKIDNIQFPSLSDSRRPVLVGGLAVLIASFQSLKIDVMRVSDGALREGLLHDLIGRFHDEDIRDRTINDMAQRYSVDIEQAGRVRETALEVFDQVAENWSLDQKTDRKFIGWAAEIHEIGLSIAHSQYHRHGAYLLANSDMPGFSRQDQVILAELVRNHRRKILTEQEHELFDENRDKIRRLTILLRLAVVLRRSRLMTALPAINVKVSKNSIRVKFPKNWLEGEPLTSADLETEAGYLDKVGFELTYQ